jgi:hypothetical protein
MSIAGPQECRDELVCLTVEHHQRVVHVGLVVAVVVGSFLVAVGGVVCGVEVQQNPFGGAFFAPLPDVELAELLSDAQASLGVGGVLQPRDRRLAGEVRSRLRQAAQHQLQERV